MRNLCFVLIASSAMLSSAALAQGVHFAYSGDEGPDHWSSLDARFSACQAGKSQSPINVSGVQDVSLPALEIDYSSAAMNFVNNGHAVQTNFGHGNTLANDYHEAAPYAAHVNYAKGSSLNHLDSTYELKQFHFHSPSEHTVNGSHMPVEIHFVHGDENGHLAVVSVLATEGESNPEIAKLWQSLPEDEGDKVELSQTIGASNLLPSSHDYYYYQGSLTTPPCSEGVRWLIMEEMVTMSRDQIASLQEAIGFENNRPVQGLNGRPIFD